MARFKVKTSVMFLISAGRLFHFRGPATVNALSPNLDRVRGISYWFVAAERSLRRPGSVEIGVVMSCDVGRTYTIVDGVHQ